MTDDYMKLVEEAHDCAEEQDYHTVQTLRRLAKAVETLVNEREEDARVMNMLRRHREEAEAERDDLRLRVDDLLIIQDAMRTERDATLCEVEAERDALRAQLDAALSCLSATDPGNPFAYDPSEDGSVDESNRDEVVEAAVSVGWNAGAFALGERIRSAIRLATETPVEGEQA